jgi:hypothetical protein
MRKKQLRLTAKVHAINPYHSTIRVWQNGGLCGELTVTSDVAEEVIRRIMTENKKDEEETP